MSQPSPKKKKKEKLTAAEKAAQRRAKILARGQNRINFLFGQTEDTTVVSSAADLTQEEVVIAQQVIANAENEESTDAKQPQFNKPKPSTPLRPLNPSPPVPSDPSPSTIAPNSSPSPISTKDTSVINKVDVALTHPAYVKQLSLNEVKTSEIKHVHPGSLSSNTNTDANTLAEEATLDDVASPKKAKKNKKDKPKLTAAEKAAKRKAKILARSQMSITEAASTSQNPTPPPIPAEPNSSANDPIVSVNNSGSVSPSPPPLAHADSSSSPSSSSFTPSSNSDPSPASSTATPSSPPFKKKTKQPKILFPTKPVQDKTPTLNDLVLPSQSPEKIMKKNRETYGLYFSCLAGIICGILLLILNLLGSGGEVASEVLQDVTIPFMVFVTLQVGLYTMYQPPPKPEPVKSTLPAQPTAVPAAINPANTATQLSDPAQDMMAQMMKNNGMGKYGGYLSTASNLLSLKQRLLDPMLNDARYFIFFYFIFLSLSSLLNGWLSGDYAQIDLSNDASARYSNDIPLHYRDEDFQETLLA